MNYKRYKALIKFADRLGLKGASAFAQYAKRIGIIAY